MTQQTYDPNEILFSGGGSPAWKFENPGTNYTGVIASVSARQERDYDRDNPGGGALKFFPSGDPIMGIVIELVTDQRTSNDDDGKRTFYAEGRYVKEALRAAVIASGVGKLEIGARLTVTFTHREDPMDKRSRKYWAMTYVPAAQNALSTAVPTEAGPVNPATGEVLGQAPAAQQPPWPTQAAPAAPPVQQAAPVAPPAEPVYPPGISAEIVAAVRANGQDPAVIFPGYVPGPNG